MSGWQICHILQKCQFLAELVHDKLRLFLIGFVALGQSDIQSTLFTDPQKISWNIDIQEYTIECKRLGYKHTTSKFEKISAVDA